MPAKYFAGKNGFVNIVGFPNGTFKINKWTYLTDKSLLEISNTKSQGTTQFIGNFNAGSISASGYMTDELLAEATDEFSDFHGGVEVKFDLYLDFDSIPKLGFTDIDAILDDIQFSDTIDGVATFEIKALVNQPLS